MDRDIQNGRKYEFDNYKVLLIILVVFGHILEIFTMRGDAERIRALVYSFHMPAFIFISGYFSRNIQSAYGRALKNCLLPFLVFNGIWLVLNLRTGFVDVFMPAYQFWYLLSLYIWRITAPSVSRLRFAVPLTLLISLYIGCFHEADRFFSISRTFVYYPFFLLGYCMTEKTVKRIRSFSRLAGAGAVCAGLALTLWLNISGRAPVKTYENLQCYHCSGIGNLEGIGIRLLTGIVAAVILLGLLNLMSGRRFFFTSLGERTVVVYLLSAFFVRFLRSAADRLGVTADIQSQTGLLLAVAIPATLLIVCICSRKWVVRLYQRFFDGLARVLLKSES